MGITTEEYRALAKPKKQGRYGASKRVKTEDGNFDSKGEYARWLILKQAQERGEIADLQRQVRYEFIYNGKKICAYIADFQYLVGNFLIVSDFKGRIITPEFRIKLKLMDAFYDIQLYVITEPKAEIRP